MSIQRLLPSGFIFQQDCAPALRLPGVRFLTGQSGFLAICPVINGDQTGQALVRILVLLCIVLQTAQQHTQFNRQSIYLYLVGSLVSFYL